MPEDANGYTHYVVLNEMILGEAQIIERCNEWILACTRETGHRRAKAENRALVPKNPN